MRPSRFPLVLLPLVLAATPAIAGMPAFTTARFAVPDRAERVQAADVDGDGDRDLVVLSIGRMQSALTVLKNDGSGAFTGGFSAALPATSVAAAPDLDVADFDLDGDADVSLVVPGTQGQVRLNDGAGGFAAVVPLTVPGNAVQVAVGLLDAGAVPDLGVYSLIPAGALSGWQGAGNGTFSFGSSVVTGNDDPNANIRLGDLTGDGKLDFVRAGAFGVEYFPSQPGAGFPTWGPPTLGWHDPCADLELAHVDGDALLDVVVTIPASGAIEVFHGKPGGGLGGPGPYPGGGPSPGPLAMGDLDQDNVPDAIVASLSIDQIAILPGGPGGIYIGSPTLLTGNRAVTDIVVAELDGDGDLDFVATLRGGWVVVVENKLVP